MSSSSKPSQSIAYSILELASVAAGSTIRQTFEKSLNLAQQAEVLGYKRFWLAEHHNMKSIASSATAVLIGHVAAGTRSIRVGSGGIMLPNHSPLIVAEQFGTLGSLHPGRIDLGMGRAPGTDQVTAIALRSDRMQAIRKFPDEVAAVRSFFQNNEGARVRAAVAEGVEMPLYILGSSTDSAHVAAQMGLPYAFASHFAPTHLQEALEIYHREFQPSSQLAEPYTIAGINVIASDTDEQARRMFTSSLRMILGVLTNNIDYLQEPEEYSSEYERLTENPAIQRMLQYAFIGNQQTVADQTKAFMERTEVDEVIVGSHIYHHQDRVHSYALFAEVMQSINQERLATQPVGSSI